MYKKLNLFLLDKKIKNKINNLNIYKNIKFFKYIKIYNYNFIKFFFKLIHFITILKNINKSLILIGDNFIIIIYKSVFYKSVLKYKFFNTNRDLFTKIIFMYNIFLVLNFSTKLIKLKSQHDRLHSLCINNFNFNFLNKKVTNINIKLLILISYSLL